MLAIITAPLTLFFIEFVCRREIKQLQQIVTEQLTGRPVSAGLPDPSELPPSRLRQ